MTSDRAVVQLDVEQCASYTGCSQCAADPYCGWDVASAACQHKRSVARGNCNPRPHFQSRNPGIERFPTLGRDIGIENGAQFTKYLTIYDKFDVNLS